MLSMNDKIMGIGIMALILLSGIMAIVFVSYIKNILRKIDDVSHVGPLIRKVEELVLKVEKIFTTLEVTREMTNLEINQLKERVSKIEHLIEKIIEERAK